MANDYLRRGAVVALVLLTVIGMTATPAMANSTPSHGDDCDLVDVDGDNNDVSVDMQNSDVNINCGDGGDDGGDGTAADDGGDADDGDKMTVEVNGEQVDASADGADGQDGQDGADGQDGQDGEDSQQQEQQQDDGQQQQQQQQQQQDTDVDVDTGDDDADDGAGDGGDSVGGDGGDGGDNAETGDNEQNIGDVDDSTILQFLFSLDFIDQSEVNAAINNENISNSTIVNNIVNGDQTINLTSVYIDDSVTNIDNSTTIVVNNNGTIVIEDGPGDGIDDGDDGDDGDVNETAPDISVEKNSDTDEVELGLLDEGGDLLQANEPVTFTVEVTNDGNATAENVVVNDEDVIADISELEDTTGFLVTDSSTSQGSFDAATGDFDVGTLEPGETATLTFDALAVSTDASLLDPGAEINATNVAELVESDPEDPNADNDVGSEEVTLVSALDTGTETPSPSPSPSLSPAESGTAGFISGGSMPSMLGMMGVVGLLGSVLIFRRD
jgi:hypothetical protein